MSDFQQLTSLLRPRTLEDFVGNSGILRIVKKNLMNKTFAHLAIFTGTNGVGKSSMAEYIGQALTCERVGMTLNVTESIRTVLYNPCGTCKSCRQALESKFMNGAVKKFNMATICDKREVLDVLKEIFVFEGSEDNNVFILEEFQSLRSSDQEVFLEYLTKVPPDVYVFICTDRMSDIIPAIRNRFTEIALEKPTLLEATDFVETCAKKVGVKIASRKVAKLFAKVNNCNPRSIVTSLELFRSMGIVEEDTLKDLFKVDDEKAQKLWAKLCDPDVMLADFLTFAYNLADEGDIINIYKALQTKAVKNLIESKTPIDETEYSTVEKGEMVRIITSASKSYSKILEILMSNAQTQEEVFNILARAKMTGQVVSVPEKHNVAKASTRSVTATNFMSKYTGA